MDRERPHPESVTLEISDCSKEDARIVFDTLCACFESDRCAEDVPEQLHATRPMVWLGTFEVSDVHDCARPAPLASSVTADVQGGYWAIERFRTTLDSVFRVKDLSSASGDQETELHLLLESR
ncbi:hypothetical protein ACIP6Q_38485 [Streptomyces bobili]|uniref:hypothetical protein n=1 Tax=Streptomyces bobili TaxID=67280 RepID=UPI0036E4C7F4